MRSAPRKFIRTTPSAFCVRWKCIIRKVRPLQTNLHYRPIYIVLTYEPRAMLYERINMRVDKMFDEGLLEEAKTSIIKNMTKPPQACRPSAIKNFDYFNGKTTLSAATETTKQRSRNLAKRQLTWFKKTKTPIFQCRRLPK